MGAWIILLCALGFYGSWRAQAKGNHKLALILLVLCGAALRVFAASDLYNLRETSWRFRTVKPECLE